MLRLVIFFFDLARLRRAPQDLPESLPLLIIFVSLTTLVGAAEAVPIFTSAFVSFVANLVRSITLLVLIRFLLQFKNVPGRWVQTATAYFGIAFFVNVISIVIAEIFGFDEVAAPVALFSIVLVIWMHITFGHILRHALEVGMGMGIFLAVVLSVLSGIVLLSFPIEIPDSLSQPPAELQ